MFETTTQYNSFEIQASEWFPEWSHKMCQDMLPRRVIPRSPDHTSGGFLKRWYLQIIQNWIIISIDIY